MLEICWLCHIFVVVMVVTYDTKEGRKKGGKGNHYEMIFGIRVSMDRDACKCKVAYIWIFPNPVKTRPILRSVVVLFVL